MTRATSLVSEWVVNCHVPDWGPGQISVANREYLTIQFEGRDAEFDRRDLHSFLVRADSKQAAEALCKKLAAKTPDQRHSYVAEFATAARRELRAAAIRAVRDERQIRHLVHFTPLENLASIARDGALHSRAWLVRQGREFLPCDEVRRDGDAHINLSVEFPNYRMFYRKRRGLGLDETSWAVLVFDALLLEELECAFVRTNAAARDIDTHDRRLTTAAAFRDLFRPTVRLKDGQRVSRTDLAIPCSYPTDPQSEVLVRQDVSLEYLVHVAVFDRTVLQDPRFPEALVSRARSDHRLFGWREDHEAWSNNVDSEREAWNDDPPFELL